MNKKKKKLNYTINYDTQWIHPYLEVKYRLYFKANTPIEIIIPKLQNRLNHFYRDLHANYDSKGANFAFGRLYRNVIPHFKEWTVLYRKPKSKEDYHPISEKIGYKPRAPKLSLKQNILKHHMLWTHELYPLIETVSIKGASSCETIAKRLNHQVNNPNYKPFLKKLEPHFVSLANSYVELNKSNSFDRDDFKLLKDPICLKFSSDLKTLHKHFEPLDLLMNRDYEVQGYNITDLLQPDRNVKTTKGWSVEKF